MPEDDLYVIAVKRERRAEVSPGWVDVVRGTSGITIVGDANPSRLQVRASPEAIRHLQACLSDDVYIEPLIPHRPS